MLDIRRRYALVATVSGLGCVKSEDKEDGDSRTRVAVSLEQRNSYLILRLSWRTSPEDYKDTCSVLSLFHLGSSARLAILRVSVAVRSILEHSSAKGLRRGYALVSF